MIAIPKLNYAGLWQELGLGPLVQPSGPSIDGLSNVFASTSFWQTPLADDAPLETSASKNGTTGGKNSYVQRLVNQAHYTKTSTPVAGYNDPPYNVYVNIGSYSLPYYIIPPDHPTQKVTWMTDNGNGPPADDELANGLQLVLNEVPVPIGPAGERFETYYGMDMCAGGTDREVVFYKPDTDELWEFWLWNWNDDEERYECGYGGYLANVSESDGVLPHNWGARATSLCAMGGVGTMTELMNGVIPHMLGLGLTVTGDHDLPLYYQAPATRYDSASVTPSQSFLDGIPEGTMFRLPHDYEIDPDLYDITKIIITAARDYGLIVVDTSGTVNFQMEDDRTLGTPYCSVTENNYSTLITNGGNYWGNLMDDFPWSDLVQLAVPS